jgi:leader peptidase (prepilin peptidase)/N-methyltransferase
MRFCDGLIPMHFFRAKKLSCGFIMRTEANARAVSDKMISSSKVHIVQLVGIGTEFVVTDAEVLQLQSTRDMFIASQTFLSAAFFVVLVLICGHLALIDLRRGIIPDAHNLAIAGLGLARTVVADGALGGAEAIAETLAVGTIFWLFRRFYFVLRKIQGLGLGDVKFLAAATPWVGLAGIPVLLLVAALSALIAIGGQQVAGQNLTRETSLPFGPFLAIGLLSALAVQQWLGVG